MTTQDHLPDPEGLLSDLLWLDSEDPRRVRLLAEHPELRERLEQLEEAAARIDGAARSDLARLEREVAGPGAGREPEDGDLARRAMDRLRREVASRPGGGRRAAPRRWPLYVIGGLAAAAALLVYLDSQRGDRHTHEPPGGRTLLNEGQRDALGSPSGAVETVEHFHWAPAPAPGTVQRVHLWYDPLRDGPADHQSPSLTSPEWTPPESILGALGTEFRWAVMEQNPITGEQRRVLEERVRVQR